jgi:hypothetical protein
MDCILGYHTNPLTCGIARFNRALADQLGLKVVRVFSDEALAAKTPLLSFKASEMSPHALDRLGALAARTEIWPGLRLFFHDFTGTEVERRLIERAQKIYCGNDVLAAQMQPLHPNVIKAWCPGYLFERREFDTDAEIKIYTFGMAHKLRTDYFDRLHTLLERSGKRYVVYISAAIHEDTSLDDSFTAAYLELQKIFGDRIFFLGFVSDAALHAYLKTCTYFAAFFQSGVRANNTSVSTAMQAGAVVLTNLDEGSPSEFRHGETLVDIRQCDEMLPLDQSQLGKIALAGRDLSVRLGWPPLVELFGREETLQPPIER